MQLQELCLRGHVVLQGLLHQVHAASKVKGERFSVLAGMQAHAIGFSCAARHAQPAWDHCGRQGLLDKQAEEQSTAPHTVEVDLAQRLPDQLWAARRQRGPAGPHSSCAHQAATATAAAA